MLLVGEDAKTEEIPTDHVCQTQIIKGKRLIQVLSQQNGMISIFRVILFMGDFAVCTVLLSVTPEIAKMVYSNVSISTNVNNLPVNTIKEKMKRVANTCLYLDKVLPQNYLSWDNITNQRIYFSTTIDFSHETLSLIIKSTFDLFAEMKTKLSPRSVDRQDSVSGAHQRIERLWSFNDQMAIKLGFGQLGNDEDLSKLKLISIGVSKGLRHPSQMSAMNGGWVRQSSSQRQQGGYKPPKPPD